jgi:hypothetical protein
VSNNPDLWEVRELPRGLAPDLWGGDAPAGVLALAENHARVALRDVNEWIGAPADAAPALVGNGARHRGAPSGSALHCVWTS